MRPLQLKKAAPITVKPNDWCAQEDGSFRCGNVLIRNDGDTGIRANWRIYRIEKSGKLVLVHPKSRPWGYGHAGQAKIGASHLACPVEGEMRT